MKRLTHLFAVTVGPLAAILGALQKLPYPRVALVAGILLSVLGNLRTAFAPMSDDAKVKVAVTVFFGLLLTHALYGCATLSNVAKACAPATADETQAIDELFARPDLTTAEVIAAAEGGKIAICVVTEIANSIMTSASQVHAMATLGSQSPMVARAQAWVAKHP